MVGSYTASAVGQAAGTLIRIVWYDLQEPRSEFETSCHDNVVLCFRVLRKYLQHLALQFRVPGYSRKKAAPGFRILLKVLKDVPSYGRAFEWNNREMLQQRDGLCQQLRDLAFAKWVEPGNASWS